MMQKSKQIREHKLQSNIYVRKVSMKLVFPLIFFFLIRKFFPNKSIEACLCLDYYVMHANSNSHNTIFICILQK